MSKLTRRAVLGAAAVPFALSDPARAQSWPNGPIRFVVPFPPGGSTDALARIVQTGMQQRLGVNIIIENKGGASGSAGTTVVAKSPGDGNTWLFVFDTHAVNPYLMNLSFDNEKDLDPVMLVATAPYLSACNTKHDFKSLADVVASAKAKPDGLSYASVGSGSIGHLFMVLLQKRLGIKLTHVPYRGGGPAMNDALGGHVDFIIGSVALVTPQLGSGKLRPDRADRRQARHGASARSDRRRNRARPDRLYLVGRFRARRHAEGCDRPLQQGARRGDPRGPRDQDVDRKPADDAGDVEPGRACASSRSSKASSGGRW